MTGPKPSGGCGGTGTWPCIALRLPLTSGTGADVYPAAMPSQKIGFTPAESTPRFPHDPKPPAGAPNVVAIVLDDTGFGHLGAFGSDIATPHIDGLAAGGAAFNRFHVTSLCSPTRAAFFTGRNHHAVGMGFLSDIPLGYPGYHARLPKSAAALPRLLRDAATRRWPSASGTSPRAGSGRPPGRSTPGRSASGSSATTASC